jgi:hypothetical protein
MLAVREGDHEKPVGNKGDDANYVWYLEEASNDGYVHIYHLRYLEDGL